LHSKNPRVIHRDVKPKNIFITPNGCIKVGDFGVSTFVKNIPIGSDEILSEQTYVGTYCYRAPEVLSLNVYNESIDIWALGCVMFECIKFELAFPLERQRNLIDLYSRKNSSDSKYIPDLGLDPEYDQLNQLYIE
jgi:NIMA (never in mitosis gene a)-related kinase 3